jgi:hypothetical protein
MSMVIMSRFEVCHLLLTKCHVHIKDKIKFSALVLVSLSSENSSEQLGKFKCLKHDIGYILEMTQIMLSTYME